MNTEQPARYSLRLPDGRYLGRMTLTGGIEPVGPAFAYTLTDRETADLHLEHARTQLGHSDVRLVIAPVFDRNLREYVHAEV